MTRCVDSHNVNWEDVHLVAEEAVAANRDWGAEAEAEAAGRRPAGGSVLPLVLVEKSARSWATERSELLTYGY